MQRRGFLKNTTLAGAALIPGMSGYSAEMLKMFMDEEEMTPYSMMMKALKSYEVFVVDEQRFRS